MSPPSLYLYLYDNLCILSSKFIFHFHFFLQYSYLLAIVHVYILFSQFLFSHHQLLLLHSQGCSSAVSAKVRLIYDMKFPEDLVLKAIEQHGRFALPSTYVQYGTLFCGIWFYVHIHKWFFCLLKLLEHLGFLSVQVKKTNLNQY